MSETNGVSRPSEQQVERVLTEPLASGYRPNIPSGAFWGADGTPAFYLYRDIEIMSAHPQVQLSMTYYRSGISGAKFAFEASSPEVKDFAERELKKFWTRARVQVQHGYDYGWGGYEVVYDEEDGQLAFDRLIDFSPRDVAVLTRDRKYAGVRVKNVQGAGAVDLWGPDGGLWDEAAWLDPARRARSGAKVAIPPRTPAKGFWYAHNPRYNQWYGRSQLYGAWKPWRRLSGQDGGEYVVDMGVYRFAFMGPLVRYPLEDNMAAGNVQKRKNNREFALEMAENVKAGASMAFPSTRYPEGSGGGPKWEVDWPDHTLDVDSLLNYVKYLKDEISHGIGVPPELLQAADTGSGYSGRAIPLEAFLMGQQGNAEAIVKAWQEQIGEPLVEWNFGPGAWFRVGVKSILKTKMEATQGQKGPAGGSGGGQNAFAGLLGGVGEKQLALPPSEPIRVVGGQQPALTEEQIRGIAVAAAREAVRFAHAAKEAGHWITIGGKKDANGKRHGGSPVYIENGRITKGHPSLTGKKVGALDGGKEDKQPAEKLKHAGQHPGTLDKSTFVKDTEYRDKLRQRYLSENRRESSRTTPATDIDVPVGSWKIDDDFNGNYGHEIEQLREFSPEELRQLVKSEDLVESNAEGRGDDADRYAGWMKEGKKAPPISIVETDKGHFKVSDGHRRLAAAIRAGVPLRAWVSYAANTGKLDSEGQPIKTGLTHELAQKHAESLKAPDIEPHRRAVSEAEKAVQAAANPKDRAAAEKKLRNAQAGANRAEQNQSASYARALWAKKAKADGVPPDHLHSLAGEILAHDKAFKAGRTQVLQSARKLSEKLGYGSLGTLKARAAKGLDPDAVRGLDDVAARVAEQYPEEFAGHDDPQARLYDLLSEGNPEPMSEEDAYQQAFDHLSEERGAEGEEHARHAVAEDEAVPFSLQFAHAPKGGVTLQGQFFKGGEFIPGEVLAKATAAEKAKVRPGLFDAAEAEHGGPVEHEGKASEKEPKEPERGSEEYVKAAEKEYQEKGVHAKAFKAWFGPWDTDPAQASKVVNAEGEPQETHPIPGTGSVVVRDGKPVAVYHGTLHGGFTSFDKSKQAPDSLYGAGFYFTEDKSVADSYQEKGIEEYPSRKLVGEEINENGVPTSAGMKGIATYLELYGKDWKKRDRIHYRSFLDAAKQDEVSTVLDYLHKSPTMGKAVCDHFGWQTVNPREQLTPETKSVYLNIRNPFDAERKLTPDEFESLCDGLTKHFPEGRYFPPEQNQDDHGFFETTKRGAIIDGSRPAGELYDQLAGHIGKTKLHESLVAAGFDGITHVGGDRMGGGKHHRVWIAFEPTQVKSTANRGTFDPADDRIHFSLIRLSADDWTRHVGPHGGIYWQHGASGEKKYQDEHPETSAHAPAEHPAVSQLAETGRAGWDAFARVGHAAGAVERVAKTFAESGVEQRIAALPAALRAPVAGLWKLTRLGTKALYATYLAGQAAAEAVAREAGATPQQAARIKAVLTAVDVAGAKAVPLALTAFGAGAAGAAAGGFVPIGSLTYLAYSAARHPASTLRAARKALEAVTGADDGTQLSLTQQSKDAVKVLLAGLQKHDSDWFLALLFSSLDRAKSLPEAVRLAEKAIQATPEDPTPPDAKDDETEAAADAATGQSAKQLSLTIADPPADLADPAAEDVLTRANLALARLSAQAREELRGILTDVPPYEQLTRVRHWLDRTVPLFAKTLSDAQFAAVLAGMRRVASRLPESLTELSPTLGGPGVAPPAAPPPAVLAELRVPGAAERTGPSFDLWQAVEAVATPRTLRPPPPEPPWLPPAAPGEPEPGVEFPVIDEAARDLAQRKLLTRDQFDQLADDARRQAFTVAQVEGEETLRKVRDALVGQVVQGPDLKAFADRVLEEAGPGTFLSPGHLETVFRTNIQSAYSQGLDRVLEHPLVGDAFPYEMYAATHDDRVRPEHLAMETHGIGGGPVYRRDDPVYQMFKPPWSWSCRCSRVPLTKEQAAALGVEEAKRWVETDQPPASPAWVPMPPFAPPEGWARTPVALSLAFRFAARHAPKGGVTVQGTAYRGGEFIPADVMARATAEEKAKVEGGGDAGGAKAEGKGEAEEEGGEKAKGDKAERPEWDGSIVARDVYRRTRASDIASFDVYDDEDHHLPHDVVLVQGLYDPAPDDPNSEPVTVYRWESQWEGERTDFGEWTTDEDEAVRDGEHFAEHNDMPEPEGGEKEEEEEADATNEYLLRQAAHVFGNLDDNYIVTVTGVPAGAKVKKSGVKKWEGHYSDDAPLDAYGVEVEIEHPKLLSCRRFLGIDADGNKFIKNDLLEIKPEYAGEGLGSSIFAGEVESAIKEGFSYIQTHAAGNATSSMNGYYTWPRLGYNQSIDRFAEDFPTQARLLRRQFPDADDVLDVMVSEGGKEWWKTWGKDLYDARFDLAADSKSRLVLDAYLEERKARKG